jgi:hypothetical protein
VFNIKSVTNPSKLRICLCKIPTVITETFDSVKPGFSINRAGFTSSVLPEAAEAFRKWGGGGGYWPKEALLYMIKIKRFYFVHESNKMF